MRGKGENQKYVLKLPGYPLHSPVVSFWHPACRNMGLKKRGAPRCTIGRRCRGGHTEGRGFPSPPARKKPSEEAQNPYLPGGNEMKKIRVNIKPFKLDSVKSSLSEAGVHGHRRHVRERERCRGSGRSVGHLHAPAGIRKARKRHKPQWDPGMTASCPIPGLRGPSSPASEVLRHPAKAYPPALDLHLFRGFSEGLPGDVFQGMVFRIHLLEFGRCNPRIVFVDGGTATIQRYLFQVVLGAGGRCL